MLGTRREVVSLVGFLSFPKILLLIELRERATSSPRVTLFLPSLGGQSAEDGSSWKAHRSWRAEGFRADALSERVPASGDFLFHASLASRGPAGPTAVGGGAQTVPQSAARRPVRAPPPRLQRRRRNPSTCPLKLSCEGGPRAAGPRGIFPAPPQFGHPPRRRFFAISLTYERSVQSLDLPHRYGTRDPRSLS